ncbi:MAG: cell division protein ZapA [Solitalea-like symbiont of Acarus siro]
MDEISIKVQIAERMYPIQIKKQEESFVRSAAKDINNHIQNLQQNYQVRDMQDLLSMSLIHYAALKSKLEQKLQDSSQEIATFLDEINDIMLVNQ